MTVSLQEMKYPRTRKCVNSTHVFIRVSCVAGSCHYLKSMTKQRLFPEPALPFKINT